MTTVTEAMQLNAAVYHITFTNGVGQQSGGTLPPGWSYVQGSAVDNVSNGSGGVVAATYVNNANSEIYVAIQGTQPGFDYLTDLGIGLQIPPTSQINAAASYLSNEMTIAAAEGYSISAGGHSLAGMIVNYLGAQQAFSQVPFVAEDAPNLLSSDISTTANVININANNDIIGHTGQEYGNSIDVDVSPAPGFFGIPGLFTIPTQFGPQGTHSSSLIASTVQSQDSTLAQTVLTPTMGATINASAIDAPNVTSITLGSQPTHSPVTDSGTQNADGSYTESATTTDVNGNVTVTTTTLNANGTINNTDVVSINITTGVASETITNGSGAVTGTGALTYSGNAENIIENMLSNAGNVIGTSDISVSAAGAVSATLTGEAAPVVLAGATVSLAAGTSTEIGGSINTVNAVSGDTITDASSSTTFSGAGYGIVLAAPALSITDDASNLQFNNYAGDSGIITVGVSNTGIIDDAGGALTIKDASGVTGGTITLDAGVQGFTDDATGGLTVNYGSGETGGTAYLGAGNVVLTDSASGLTVQDASGVTGGTVTLNTSNESLTDAATNLTVQDNTGLSGGNLLYDTSNSLLSLTGSNFDVTKASGVTGDQLTFNANATGEVNGAYTMVSMESGSNVSILTNSDPITIGGAGVNTTASNDPIYTVAGAHYDLTGNGDTNYLGTKDNTSVTISANDTDYIYASNETIHGSSGDNITVYGSNVTVDMSGGTVTYKGNDDLTDGNNDRIAADGSGDDYDGSGDYYSGGTQSGNGGGGGGSTAGSSGVAAGLQRSTNVISQYDLAHGLSKAAAAANAAWSRTSQAIGAASGAAGYIAPSQIEGAQWSGNVVTWSFANSAGSSSAPFSGYVQSAYQAAIEQAFQTWASAAGITLEEVADSASTDIRVGWGNLGTSESAVLGYTNYDSIGGVAQAGVIIRLEDPNDDPLVADANGDGGFTYSGTSTTLEQVALHEVGHALGLAESSDPNSVMYAELGTQNTTLDANDVANIRELYQSSATAGMGTASLFVQALATFSPSTSSMLGSTTTATSTASTSSLLPQLASASG
jgi:predicted Zn-dependent protease